MKINIAKTELFAIIIAIVVVFMVLNMPWIVLTVGGQLSPNPPAPEITYGEFPFRLEYEINGEQIEVKDTLICEFDGFGFDTGRGKFRKWKSKLKSGNTRITLLKSEGIEILYSPGLPSSRIAGVYMGDVEYYPGSNKSTFPDAWYTSDFEDKTVNEYIISADEMWEKYKIRLISWEPAEPIQNTFK